MSEIPTYTPVQEAEFWKTIESFEWTKDLNYKRIQLLIRDKYTQDQEKALCGFKIALYDFILSKWALLNQQVIKVYRSRFSVDEPFHYGDTLHHIIGLGRKTYEEDLADVSVVSLWYHGQREPKVRASFQCILLQPGDPDDKEDFDSIVAKESDCIVAVKYGEA
jgi:hypothetical protein